MLTQKIKTRFLEFSQMDEDILASIIRRNKPKTFVNIVKLNLALGHKAYLLVTSILNRNQKIREITKLMDGVPPI